MIPIKDNIPSDRFPIVTLGLIVASIVVYVVAVAHGGAAISGPDLAQLRRYGLTASAPTAGTVFSGMLLNASIVQLAGNMLFLWLFGATIEDAMGSLRFLGFYVVAGLVAAGVLIVLHAGSPAPVVGAAGAVAGTIGAYLLLYPRARMLTLVLVVFLFGVVEVPMLLLVGLWLAMQAAFGNGVDAFAAALGGLAFGALAIRPLAIRRKPTPPTAAAYR